MVGASGLAHNDQCRGTVCLIEGGRLLWFNYSAIAGIWVRAAYGYLSFRSACCASNPFKPRPVSAGFEIYDGFHCGQSPRQSWRNVDFGNMAETIFVRSTG